MIDSFRAVIALWPSHAAFAADIGRRPGTVRMWSVRDMIPSECWAEVIGASKVRGIAGVTPDLFVDLASRRKTAAGGDEIGAASEGAPANA